MENLNNSSLPENPTDKLVADALNTQKEALTEEQTIFKSFQDNLNLFIKKVGDFGGSKSQLQRVLINLAISPLNKEELHHGYVDEKELFDIGTEVNSAKFFLMLHGMENQGKLIFVEQEDKSVEKSEVTDAQIIETVKE
jgi:hypothetical protein